MIFTAGDPVKLGLVTTLNRPGGNVTGATSLGGELGPKRLEFLHELMPRANDAALLVNPTNPTIAESAINAIQGAARSLVLQLHIMRASSPSDFDTVFMTLAQRRPLGLVIAVDSFFTGRREQLATMALRHGIPAIYQYRDFAAAGGVMSYGGNLDPYRLVGQYTGRILKGEKPAEMPVHQATKLELVINRKAVTALGLTVPPPLLLRADEIIE